MRKLKLQVQMTIDGFIAGPNGEMNWMTLPWTEDLNKYVGEITATVDTIVLGRKLAEGFIPYWASVAENSDAADFIAGQKFTNTLKVVFTKTLQQSTWNNTVLAKGNLTQEINQLKEQDGNDIIAYGGAMFVSSLIKEGLIDEFNLLINPTAIGSGMAIFKDLDSQQSLNLVGSTAFECGIVAFQYELKRS
ncbi:dihydrofolate reductase family protein [Mucilaginibacter sp. PAMB04168]|uniref:dihydrofolate reductase family protein n=1 Tax=Mucilaginibacter sp. PAMB04168 TaxID=3138567 RepID=UPI0031F60967